MTPTYPYAVPAMPRGETIPIQARKRRARNTTVTSAKNNIILGIGSAVIGKTHDIALLREDPPPFGGRYEKMCDGDTPKNERFAVYMDLGYHGIKKDLLGADVILPHKKPKKSREEEEIQRLTKAEELQQKGRRHQGGS